MNGDETRPDRLAVVAIASVLIVNALLFFLSRSQTFVHIDAIAHVNKARGLFDNFTPGIRQLGSIWLPLQHLLIAPFTWINSWWASGVAGSLLSVACFVGTSYFLYSTGYAWTGARLVGWMSFFFFAFNPRLIYLFTTPMTEPLMILCIAGLVYFLIQWSQTQAWREFAFAALFAFAGTLTRYEGWAIAAAAIPVVALVGKRQRLASTILFAGAVAAGPMLWMIFNSVYFDDPLMFSYGRGSARDYAQEYFFRTGQSFPTAGDWSNSFMAYIANVAYCINPLVLWLAAGGFAVSWAVDRFNQWRATLIIATAALVPFAYYVVNLYSNMVPLLMPGLVADEPQSIYNVRYGTVMAATLPLFAAFLLCQILRWAERRRAFSLLLLTPLLLPDPVPAESGERPQKQFTQNLFYMEGIHNQSFWMPPFVKVAHALKAELQSTGDEASLILTNTRIVHPVVWATAIPMRRFIHEMNQDRWRDNLNNIDPGIRWVITEEGDQLWHARGKFLRANFIEVASAKTPSTGMVRLFRRR